MFSERRELALSLVSCLLPSSSPPSFSPPPPCLPPVAAAKHCSQEPSQDRAVAGFALPRPAVPPLGVLCPGKNRSWGSSCRNVDGETASLPLRPPWHQVLSCRGLAWLTWPGLWATPMSGHLSREGW